jgi:hypothetical protein
MLSPVAGWRPSYHYWVRKHQSLRRVLLARLLARVDHGLCRPLLPYAGPYDGRWSDICRWRNEYQRTLASRYATEMAAQPGWGS